MEELPIVEVLLKVRKALPSDLKIDDKKLNIGLVFWLRSMVTGQFMNEPMKIHSEIDVYELSEWLKNDMIYVPIKWSEVKFKEDTTLCIAE